MFSSFALVTIAIGKALIGIAYLCLAIFFAPKFDTTARMSTVKTVRLVLVTFFSLTVATYAHLSFFAVAGILPVEYWRNIPYIAILLTHSSVAIVVIILTFTVSNFRTVNDKEYDNYLSRSMDKEIENIPSEDVQKEIRKLSDEVLQGKDMADKLLKAYK